MERERSMGCGRSFMLQVLRPMWSSESSPAVNGLGVGV